MGKVLKVVGAVVGVAALLIPGVGAAITGAIYGTLAGGAVGAAAAAAFTLGQVVVAGLSLYGVAALGQALGPKAPKVPSAARDRLYASIDPSTPRKIVFGKTAMATDIRYEEWGGTDQEYLDRIIAVASHKVESVTEIWFDDKLAWSSSGGVQAAYSGYLTVAVREEGTSANTIAINGGSKWGSSRRLTGCAYLHLRYKTTGNSKKASSPFASSIPQRMTVIGCGALVYDPRLDSTAGGSGSHRANDQSTWRWVNDATGMNPALQILWYLLGWKIGGKLAVGRGIPPARIDMASFIAAANLCDESVALAGGGTQARYRSAGVVSEADAATSVLDALTAACAGTLRDAGGKLALDVLHNDLASPVAAFTDDDVIDEFDWQQAGDIAINEVRGRYTDPSSNALYQLVDYPAAKIASPDGIERPHTLDLAFVQVPGQAQRLAKQVLQRAQYDGIFRAEFKATAWRCQVGDCVTLTFSALGFVAKKFRVTEQIIRMNATVGMTLREENTAIYAWSAEDVAAVSAAAPTVFDPLNAPLIQGILEAGAAPGQNTLFNGSFTLGSEGWSMGSLFVTQDYRGNIVQQPTGTGGEFVATSSRPINVLPGEVLTLSAWFSGSATTLRYLFVDIQWVNGGNGAHLGYSSTPGAGDVLFYNESGVRLRKEQQITAPAATDGSGFVKAIVRIIGGSDVAYVEGTRWVEQIKVEYGTAATDFSDERTNTAVNTSAVGSISASDVSSTINSGGGVANNKVATPAIVANAVTTSTAAFTSGSLFMSTIGSFVNIAVATFSATGAPVNVTFAFSHNVSVPATTCSFAVQLTYNGAIIWSTSFDQGAGPLANNFMFQFLHTPGSGSCQYAVDVAFTGGSGLQVWDRSISMLEAKR